MGLGVRTGGPAAGALAVLGVALLTACGGGSSAARPATPSTTARSGGGAPSCQTSQLQAALEMPDAGAGQRYVTLVLTNTGATCQLTGYVGLQLLAAGGAPIPTLVAPDTGRLVPVTLAPGGTASTPLHWAGIPLSDEAQTGPCEPQPTQVEITPPDQTQSLTTAWTLDPVCGHGRIDVSPLVRGVPRP
ncbi:MAG TPA: DUF4232 domain-containing protein [Acidimicrobiia bacterium]